MTEKCGKKKKIQVPIHQQLTIDRDLCQNADSFYICRFSVAQVVPEIQAKLDISWYQQ